MAILAPRGSSWTWTAGGRCTDGLSTTSPALQPRSAPPGCRTRWRTGSPTGSDPSDPRPRPVPNRTVTATASKVRPRMRHAPRALLAGGLGFAASLLVACGGGGGLLTGGQSANLNSRLDSVAAAVDARHCSSASRAVVQFSNDVNDLPAGLNPTLRRNLLQGASTVGALALRECQATSSTSSTTSSTSTTSTTTTTTTPSTSSTTTGSTSTTTPSTSTTPATSTTTPGTTTTNGGTGGAGLGGNSAGGGASGNSGNGQ